MRHIVLSLLADGPQHGYELRGRLEQVFAAVLPSVNPGQIYVTLQRLERDGSVVGVDVPGDTRHKRVYELTEAGRAELDAWIDAPVTSTHLKDEFFMKLVLIGSRSRDTARRLIDVQRREYLQTLRDLDQLARSTSGDRVAGLLVEGAQLHVEADLRWLELCAERLVEEPT